MVAEPKHFVDLFDHVTIEKMHSLTPREFERFMAYVLRRAGYTVKEVGPHFLRGVDLEMRMPGKSRVFGGVECKKYAPTNVVTAPVVKGVKGAPAVDKPSAKPFVVTTSDFNEPAHQMAEAGSKRAYLLNGQQLIRYIMYIKGSRRDDDDTSTTLSPEFFAGREQVDVMPRSHMPSQPRTPGMVLNAPGHSDANLLLAANPGHQPPTPDNSANLSFNLAQNCGAKIFFTGHVTQEAVRKLIALLDLSVDTFPAKGQGKRQSQEAEQPDVPDDLPELFELEGLEAGLKLE